MYALQSPCFESYCKVHPSVKCEMLRLKITSSCLWRYTRGGGMGGGLMMVHASQNPRGKQLWWVLTMLLLRKQRPVLFQRRPYGNYMAEGQRWRNDNGMANSAFYMWPMCTGSRMHGVRVFDVDSREWHTLPATQYPPPILHLPPSIQDQSLVQVKTDLNCLTIELSRESASRVCTES